MDFTLDEGQEAIAGLARDVLGRDGKPPESWRDLASAGLLGLALPPDLGGDGLGAAEIAVVLAETGRAAAAVPAWPTLSLGVLPLTHLGTAEQHAALLPEVASGDAQLTAALHEPSAPLTKQPSTTAIPDGAGWRLTGVKIGVPYAATASRILVPASIPGGGTGLFLVDPAAGGGTLTATHTASGAPEHTLRMANTPAERLGDLDAVDVLHRYALAGAVALGDGALAGALDLTTTHVKTREQFGRPLAAFQAVAQQIADVYIVSRTLHLAAASASWRLGAGLESDTDLDVAAYWLAEETPRALATCHHLHGGLGMDVTYPLHRYSSLVKDLVRAVGGVTTRLEKLSELVAEGA